MSRGGSIAVGLADGILKGLQIRKQWERDDEDKAARAEERTYRNEERDYTRGQRKKAEGLEISLQNAARPATVSQSGALPDGLQFASNEDADAAAAGQPNAPMPQVPQFRVESGAGAQRFDTQGEADKFALQQHDPAAVQQRVGQAYMAAGKPTEGLEYQKKAEEYAEKHWRRQLGTAMTGGFGGIEQFINSNEAGPFKGKQVKFIPSEDGKQVVLHTVGADGKTVPTKLAFPNDEKGPVMAGYMLDQAVTPEARYKLQVENDRKAADLERKTRELDEVKIPRAEANAALSEARATTAEAQATLALARAEHAGKTGSGGGRTTADERATREERMRYTSLHGESGRRLSDAQKSLRTLQTDPVFMMRAKKKDSAEAAQLQNLLEDVDQYKKDREMYGGLLGGSTVEKARAAKEDGATPTPGGAKPAAKAGKGKVATPASKAEYEAIPKGAKYQHPDDPAGTYRTKK